jgi:hypothetical protein
MTRGITRLPDREQLRRRPADGNLLGADEARHRHTRTGETRVFRKILSALGMGEAHAPRPTPRHPASGPQPIKPYRDDSCNFIYNLLFCDDLKLFETPDPSPPMTTLLAERPDAAALREIANDAATYDSRIRVVAFNRLREMGEPVPSKLLLGVILEVPVNGGLDTLGAFADGTCATSTTPRR